MAGYRMIVIVVVFVSIDNNELSYLLNVAPWDTERRIPQPRLTFIYSDG
jgi:hypothetical protein